MGFSSSGISLCSTMASSMGCRGYLLFHGDVHPALCSHSVVPFLKHVLPEVSPAWLRDSAVLCSVSWVWLCPAQGSLWPLRTVTSPLPTTCHINLEHRVSKILRTQFISWVMRFCPPTITVTRHVVISKAYTEVWKTSVVRKYFLVSCCLSKNYKPKP